MPLNLHRLAILRPYLYHLTAQQNLTRIRSTGELRCATALLDEAGLPHHSRVRRKDHLELSTGILVRDQKPLLSGAIAFEEGWGIERFVAHVNDHVFFWPGNADGPITAGMNHYARYAPEHPVILRFRIDEAALATLCFSRYNSGAPRCSGGKYSPRGSQTYLPADRFNGTPSEVTEVVAKGKHPLPTRTEFAFSPLGPWRPYAGAA